MDTEQKACVILGAGASKDVYNGSLRINQERFQPPLAKDLFRADYADVMSPYPGAQYIASLLTPMAGEPDFNLEAELRKLAEHKNSSTRDHFRHVPPYLHDLLANCSRDYTELPGSYMQLAFELLAEAPHELLFLVLNYDDLLENALRRFDPKIHQFSSFEHYISKYSRAWIVKLHGSINWYRLMGPVQGTSWEDHVQSIQLFEKPPDDEIIVLNNQNIARNHQVDQHWAYPVLTAPLAGKGTTNMVCPEMHIDAARHFLEDCRKFLIIGTSGRDDDLLDLLDTSVDPSRGDRYIHVVDADDSGAETTLERFQNGVRALRGTMPPGIHGLGFRNYVSSEAIKTFANSRVN